MNAMRRSLDQLQITDRPRALRMGTDCLRPGTPGLQNRSKENEWNECFDWVSRHDPQQGFDRANAWPAPTTV
jgi:hypothetical protein